MNIPTLSRDQVREIDQVAIDQFGMTGLVLMENAGRGAAKIIHDLRPAGKISILCGKGNNGGDGYVIGRHLELAGHRVTICSVVPLVDLAGDAAANAEIARLSGMTIFQADKSSLIEEAIEGADVIVDCLLGTGAKGPLRGVYQDAVAISNRQDALRVAIDLPTGVDCDSGEAEDLAFKADHTITFVAAKTGMTKETASCFTGLLHVVDIGVPRKLLTRYFR